jgi:peroxiredoxin
MNHLTIKSGSTFPNTLVKTLDGTEINLADINQRADWKMVVVYRGRHCPLCTKYLNNLERYKERLAAIGVEVIAVSADSKEQLESHLTNLEISFAIAYGLTVEALQKLGLYISNPRSEKETDHPFAEPGLFVINDKGQIHIVDISNAPFARPELETMVSRLEFIKAPENNYPIRGTFNYRA